MIGLVRKATSASPAPNLLHGFAGVAHIAQVPLLADGFRGNAQQLFQHQGVQLRQVQPPLPLGQVSQRLGDRFRLGREQVVAQLGDGDEGRARLAGQQPGQFDRVVRPDELNVKKLFCLVDERIRAKNP